MEVDPDDRRYACFELLDVSHILAVDEDYFSNLGASVDLDAARDLFHVSSRKCVNELDSLSFPASAWNDSMQATNEYPTAQFVKHLVEKEEPSSGKSWTDA